MRWFRTVILLAVPFLTVGCLPPTTSTEAGVGVVLLGFGFMLPGLGLLSQWFKVHEGKKASASLFIGASFLIGGGFIALGGWWAGWWGQ
jgi:hypothetical protein